MKSKIHEFLNKNKSTMSKKIILAMLLLATVSMSSQADYEKERNAQQMSRYKNMKTAGLIMMPAGGILIAGGVVLAVSGYAQLFTDLNDPNYNGDDFGAILKIYGGYGMAVVGGLCLAGGTVLFAVGSKKLRRLQNRVAFNVAPNAFKLTYRF